MQSTTCLFFYMTKPICCIWKCVPTAISSGADISDVPGCHLLRQISSQWESQKLLQGLVSHELTAYLSVFNIFLTQRIMSILSKCKPYNFEQHNSLKLSKYLTPLFKFYWMWIFPWIKLSWHFCCKWDKLG